MDNTSVTPRNDTGSYVMCPCISTECELMDIPLNNFVSYPLHVTDNRREVQEVTVTTARDPASETATFEPIRPNIKMIDTCWLEHGEISEMDVHPTKPWILLGHACGKVSLWNHETQEMVKEWNTNEEGNIGHVISAVKFIARMDWFVVGSVNGLIQAYSCTTDTLASASSTPAFVSLNRMNQFTAGSYGYVNSLAVHPRQPLVLSACDRLIKLFNWQMGWQCIRTFEAHSGDVGELKFNPQDDGSTFASASEDGTVKIWSIYSDTPISTLDCAPGELKSVDYFIARGDRLHIVAGSDTGTAHIWDLQSNTCIRQIDGLQTCYTNIAVVGCPQGHQILVTVSEDNVVSFCDFTTHRYEDKVHVTSSIIVGFGYIRSTRSLVIGYSHGFAIMEIME